MNKKLKVITTLVLVAALVIIGSFGSLAFAKDRVHLQTRDRDCAETPKHKHCEDELIGDQDRLKEQLKDCDEYFDCILQCLEVRANLWENWVEISEKIEEYEELELLLEEAVAEEDEEAIAELEIQLENLKLEIIQLIEEANEGIFRERNEYRHTNRFNEQEL